MAADPQLRIISRIAQLSPPHCKKCPQPQFMVADDKPSKMHFDKDSNLTVISHGLKAHESGLCFFHLKESLGIFNAKYPLKHGDPGKGVI